MADYYNITVKKNEPFDLIVDYNDSNGDAIDFDGDATLQVYEQNNIGSDLITEFNTTTGEIVVVNNTLTVFVPSIDTALLPDGEFYYFVSAGVGGEPDNIVSGKFIVTEKIL